MGHTEKLFIVYLTNLIKFLTFYLASLHLGGRSITLLWGSPQYHSLNPDTVCFQNRVSSLSFRFCPGYLLTASRAEVSSTTKIPSGQDPFCMSAADPNSEGHNPSLGFTAICLVSGGAICLFQFLFQPQELDLCVHQGEGTYFKLNFFL